MMQELGLNCSSKLYEALDSKQQEIILTYNWSVDLSICTMVYVLSKCEFCCTQMATQVLCNQGVIYHCLIPWIFRKFLLVILYSTETKSLTPCHRIYSIITCCCDSPKSFIWGITVCVSRLFLVLTAITFCPLQEYHRQFGAFIL